MMATSLPHAIFLSLSLPPPPPPPPPPPHPLSLPDTASNTEFTLSILSSSLDVTSDGRVRPLPLISEQPPSPPEYNIDSIARSEVTGEEAQRITDLAFSRLLLSHYRNQLLHLFLAESMLAMCLYHCLPCTQGEG